jgi:hypothetical protein
VENWLVVLEGVKLNNIDFFVDDIDGNATIYETAKEASRIIGVTAHTLIQHCKNNSSFKRGPYKNWRFEFKNKIA